MIKKILSYKIKVVNSCNDHLLDNKELKLQPSTDSGKTLLFLK